MLVTPWESLPLCFIPASNSYMVYVYISLLPVRYSIPCLRVFYADSFKRMSEEDGDELQEARFRWMQNTEPDIFSHLQQMLDSLSERRSSSRRVVNQTCALQDRSKGQNNGYSRQVSESIQRSSTETHQNPFMSQKHLHFQKKPA